MSVEKNNGTTRIPNSLEGENTSLKKRLVEIEAERDSYRDALHALVGAPITPEELQVWAQEEPDSGRTILDILDEVKGQGR